MGRNEQNQSIYESLPFGRKNGVRAEEIMRRHHISNKRALVYMIRAERLAGKPILQVNGYYFRSNDRKDYLDCIKSLQSRSLKIMQVSRVLYSLAPTENQTGTGEFEQMTFDDYMQQLVANACAEEEEGEA